MNVRTDPTAPTYAEQKASSDARQAEAMEHVETHLFIGGPMNGKRFRVEPGRKTISCPVLRGGRGLGYEAVDYSTMSFRGCNEVFVCFVLDGLSPDDAVRMLMESYSGKPRVEEQ